MSCPFLILFIGDSVRFDGGVSSLKDAFLAHLKKELDLDIKKLREGV